MSLRYRFLFEANGGSSLLRKTCESTVCNNYAAAKMDERENDTDSKKDEDGSEHEENTREMEENARESLASADKAGTGPSSGSPPPGVGPRHPKKPPPSGDRGGWLPPIKRFFSSETWRGRQPETLEYSKMSLEEKREHYVCGRGYLTLSAITTWSEFHKTIPYPKGLTESHYTVDPALNKKVSLWRGDITQLEIDAIVNAANNSLLGGGGVDGAIHRAASRALRRECEGLGGCATGDAKLSGGHRLPAKYILHTVGPVDSSQTKLQSCYDRCLDLVLQHNIRSVAFPCIATGMYGYPHNAAARLALKVTREWLEEHRDKVDRIIFCVHQKVDYNFYSEYLHYFYPVEKQAAQPNGSAKAAKSSKIPFKPALKSSVSTPEGSRTRKKSSEGVPGKLPDPLEPTMPTSSKITEMETAESSVDISSAPDTDVRIRKEDNEGKHRGDDGGEGEDTVNVSNSKDRGCV